MQAEKHARAAADFAPAMAEAHELYGALMANRGDAANALRELDTAVKLAPDLSKARYELGVMLYSRGDTGVGVEHLRLAAKGGSSEAAQFLKRIGQ